MKYGSNTRSPFLLLFIFLFSAAAFWTKPAEGRNGINILPALPDTGLKQDKNINNPRHFPRIVFYVSPGMGGNAGRKRGQVMSGDVTDVSSTTYTLRSVQYERPGFDLDAGLMFTFYSGSRINCMTGISVENTGYSGYAMGTSYTTRTNVPVDTATAYWNYTFQDFFIQVPVSVSFRLSRAGQNYVGLRAGLIATSLVSETCSGSRIDNFSVKSDP
ncbi:MAG TPA: hypothetical protein VNZ86_14035, partial [Bacteroidia bacterium]|nr:hypothetical protein [Bacteroidia bacterium]